RLLRWSSSLRSPVETVGHVAREIADLVTSPLLFQHCAFALNGIQTVARAVTPLQKILRDVTPGEVAVIFREAHLTGTIPLVVVVGGLWRRCDGGHDLMHRGIRVVSFGRNTEGLDTRVFVRDAHGFVGRFVTAVHRLAVKGPYDATGIIFSRKKLI